MTGDRAPVDLATAQLRIDALLARLRAAGDRVSEDAEELVGVLLSVYGEGLSRIVASLAGDDPALVDTLASDSLVSSLLLVHGLHPKDLPTRVGEAIEKLRPRLGAHGDDVRLVDVGADGVAQLQLAAGCTHCSSSSGSVADAVERAIRDAAPDVVAIEFESVAPAQPLLQIQPFRRSSVAASNR